MALYIPAGRRRRNTVLLAAAALGLGLALGWLSGRAAAPSTAAKVASVRVDAAHLATRLGALPIEYEQALANPNGETVQGGVLDALDGLQRDAIGLLDRSPWVSPDGRADVLDAIAAVREPAKQRRPATEFAGSVDAAANTVRRIFGLATVR